MQSRLERIKKQFHAQKFKLTPQRLATVQVLLKHEEEHLSAEDIYGLVKQIYPNIGLATVYRTLELLSDIDVVDKVSFGDGVSRYDLRTEGEAHFHHHLVCLACGEVEEVTEDLLSEIERHVEQEYQFHIKDHNLTFHGICLSCQNRKK